jgi:hypothetical protein
MIKEEKITIRHSKFGKKIEFLSFSHVPEALEEAIKFLRMADKSLVYKNALIIFKLKKRGLKNCDSLINSIVENIIPLRAITDLLDDITKRLNFSMKFLSKKLDTEIDWKLSLVAHFPSLSVYSTPVRSRPSVFSTRTASSFFTAIQSRSNVSSVSKPSHAVILYRSQFTDMIQDALTQLDEAYKNLNIIDNRHLDFTTKELANLMASLHNLASHIDSHLHRANDLIETEYKKTFDTDSPGIHQR